MELGDWCMDCGRCRSRGWYSAGWAQVIHRLCGTIPCTWHSGKILHKLFTGVWETEVKRFSTSPRL